MSTLKNGKLIVISGPSGVGKSTICKSVIAQTGAFLTTSVTTRPKADSEQDGKDYIFVSTDQFEKMLAAGEFLEHAEVFGNMYGTPHKQVKEALSRGETVLLEIDVQGGQKIKGLYPDTTMIFILPPQQSDLAGRLNHRARGEDSANARLRLDGASSETAVAWQFYDHMIINDDLQTAIDEVVQIVKGNTGAKE